jgi:hypothetical protein
MKGADMIEIKTPHAGEYWLSGSSLIAYVVGFTIDGDPAWQQKNSRQILSDKIGFFLACFHHEPRCDSFDWTEPAAIDPGEGWELLPVGTVLRDGDEYLDIFGVWIETQQADACVGDTTMKTYRRKINPVETWPKYYVGKNWSDADAYVRFDNATDRCVLVSAYGSTETHDETYAYVPDAIRRHSWREITEAEALARVEPHPLMDCLECGEFRGHGHVCQPAVKRVPVRLFTDDRNNMFAVCGEWPIVVGTQIKHDANGFYVEGEPWQKHSTRSQ